MLRSDTITSDSQCDFMMRRRTIIPYLGRDDHDDEQLAKTIFIGTKCLISIVDLPVGSDVARGSEATSQI